MWSPNIVQQTIPNGEVDEAVEFGPRVLREADIPETVEGEILDGLLGVTLLADPGISNPGGTGWDAFNNPFEEGLDGAIIDLINYPVAGKTGTAQVTGRADNSMFVGFGPSGSTTWGTSINTPEYVVAVVLEEAGFGSKIAAPMVARVFDQIASETVPRAQAQSEVDEFYNIGGTPEDILTIGEDEEVLEAAGGAQ